MAEDHHPIYQEISSFHREAQAEGHLSHVSVHRVEWENNPPRLTLQVFCRDSHFDEPLEVTCRFPNDLSGEIYFESGNPKAEPITQELNAAHYHAASMSIVALVAKMLAEIEKHRMTIWRPIPLVASRTVALKRIREFLASKSAPELAGMDMLLSLHYVAATSYKGASFANPTHRVFYKNDRAKEVNTQRLASALKKRPCLAAAAVAKCFPNEETELADAISAQLQGEDYDDCIHELNKVLLYPTSTLRLALADEREISLQFPEGDPARPTFEFIIEPPADPEFEALSKKHGTVVAYHGSHLDHMYSILQIGLQNFTGTHRERTGAIHGEGIYLSADLKVAQSFSQGTGSLLSDSLLATVGDRAESLKSSLASAVTASGKFRALSDALGHGSAATCEAGITCAVAAEVLCTPENIRLNPHLGEIVPAERKSSASDEYYVVPNPHHLRITRLLIWVTSSASNPANQRVIQLLAKANETVRESLKFDFLRGPSVPRAPRTAASAAAAPAGPTLETATEEDRPRAAAPATEDTPTLAWIVKNHPQLKAVHDADGCQGTTVFILFCMMCLWIWSLVLPALEW